MTDIADEIRQAVQRPTVSTTDAEAAFRKLRAHVRGVIIDTHRAMGQGQGHWTEVDDRVLDVVSNWIESLKSRS